MSLSIIKYPSGGGGGGTDMAIGGMVLGGTEGSVLFVGTAGVLAEDNPNLFYDNAQNALAVGKNTALGAKFNIHDGISKNYLGISAADTTDPGDPDLNPYTIQYYLRQVDGEWGEGFPTPGTGLRLDFTGTYNGTDPVPGLFQFGMPVWIDGDPANFVFSTVVNGFKGIKTNTDDTGIEVNTSAIGVILNAQTGVVFNGSTGLSSSFGTLDTLFSIDCESGGDINANTGDGLNVRSSASHAVQAINSTGSVPSLIAHRQSGTGSTVDPIFTMRAQTNFVVFANSGLYFNMQPALPASQIADGLRIANRWTNIASPTSETQIFGRNANVDTQVLTIQSNANGRVGIGSTVTAPTARLHLPAGSATAQTAPLKFVSGPLLTTAEAGAVEFLTDKYYGTITTGAARKEITLNDVALTSGSLPIATTNGRLTNLATGANGTILTVSSGTVQFVEMFKGGQSPFTADGTTTVFNITHNLGATPAYFSLTTTAPIASNHLNRTITFPDANTLRITFNVAPSVGEDANYVWVVYR